MDGDLPGRGQVTAGLAARAGRRVGLSSDASNRAVVTMTDQCFASASNFALGVAVARIAGAAGLGAFSVAYAAWILLTNVHRSLITDPMAIVGEMRQEEAVDRIRRGYAAEVVVGLVATVVFAVAGVVLLLSGQSAFGEAMLALAPWVTFLDLQDYWRWIGFMQGRPGKAFANDALFGAAQAAAFVVVFVTRAHSPFMLVSAWGVGALAGTVYGSRQFAVRPSLRGGVRMMRRHWEMSKWITGTAMMGAGGSQVYLILAGALLGPVALGGLKAAQALVIGPAAVVIHAGGSFGLPEASRALAQRGWDGLRRVSRFVAGAATVSVGLFGLVVFACGGWLLRLFYGSSFAGYEGAARMVSVALLAECLAIGPVLVLKATKWTRPLFYVRFIGLVSSVIAVVVLASLYGVVGAAAAALVSNVAVLVVLLPLQRRSRRDTELLGPRRVVAGEPAVVKAPV